MTAGSRLWWAALLAILAVGTGLRLRSAGGAPSLPEMQEIRRSETLEYFDLGQNLHDFGVLGWREEPSAFRGVLFPAFLSAAERYGASGPARAPVIEAALCGLEIPLAAWLGLALHSPGAALISAAFVAFHPALRELATPYQIDDFYGLLLMLVAVALAAWMRSPSAGRSWLLGFAVAASLLCRSVLFAFPPCLVLARLRGDARRRAFWVVLGASYLFLLPWVARNALQLRRFIPFEDHAATQNFFAAA
ncbi:MAG: hypothetical protein PHU21_14670, partial [Elusimicrobia bacterium]|nr:hypothetical protein [Elusimicrobiota bacterium]